MELCSEFNDLLMATLQCWSLITLAAVELIQKDQIESSLCASLSIMSVSNLRGILLVQLLNLSIGANIDGPRAFPNVGAHYCLSKIVQRI